MTARHSLAESKPSEIQVTFKSSYDFREWLGDFADSLQLSKSAAITQALMLLAEAKGFRSPPLRAPGR